MVEVEVTFDYDAEQIDELTIKVGDIIKNVKMVEGGWWEGELNGKSGMFPDNFVKVIEKSKEKEEQSSKKDTGKRGTSVKELASKLKEVPIGALTAPKNKEGITVKKKKAKVLFDYKPEVEDELKIEIGDIVEITKQEEEGWWEGILNGKKGMFPSNFVEEMDDAETEKTEKSPEDKPKETQDPPKKKIMGVGLGNIFAGGPISLRTSSGVKKEKEEVKAPPQEEAPAVVKREKPALHASTVPEFPANNYINGSGNVEHSESSQQEQFTDIISETPASKSNWVAIVNGSTDTLDCDVTTAGQDISNSYVLVNPESKAMYELNQLSEFKVLSGEKFATYVNLEGKDREENKENIVMENLLYTRSLNSSLPFKQTAIVSESNKSNNNHMDTEGAELLAEELYRLESHLPDATETNGTSACAKQSESYINICNEMEWLEEQKLNELKTTQEAKIREEKDAIFMEMDFRKTKSKKRRDSLLKRIMNMEFFRKKYKGNHSPPKSSEEGIRKENVNSVAVIKEKNVSGKHGRSDESFQNERIPLKELNLNDLRLIDSELSQSIEVSVDSSIDDNNEIVNAGQKNKDNTEEQKNNIEMNTNVDENHLKTHHASNNSHPRARGEDEEEILEQMELAMCSENFPNSQESSSSLLGSGNDPVFEGVSLDVNKDSYLGFLQRTGHLSPFIRMIASRYHLFDAKDGKWKPYNVELNQSQLGSSKVLQTNLCEFNSESNYLASQNPEEEPRKDIVTQYNICSRDCQEKARQGQECGHNDLGSKCKVKHMVSLESPNYRIFQPETAEEQNCDQLSVNQLVSDCLDKAVQNLNVIKTVQNKNAQEDKNDSTDLLNLSDADVSCKSQLEDSLYSACNEWEDTAYATAMASFDNTAETLSDDSRVQTEELAVYKFVPHYQSDCFQDISGQPGKLLGVSEHNHSTLINSYKTVPWRQTCSKYLRDHKGGCQGPWVSPVQTKQSAKSAIACRKRKSMEGGQTTSGTPDVMGFTDNTVKTGKELPKGSGTRTQIPDKMNELSLNSLCLMSKDNLMQKEDRGTSPVKELFDSVVGLEDEESPTLNSTGLNITTVEMEGKPRFSSSPIKPVDYEFNKDQQHQSQIKMETVSTQTDDLSQPGFVLKNLSKSHSMSFKPNFVENYTEPRKKRSFWKRLFRRKKNPVVPLSYRKKSDTLDLTRPVEKNVTDDQNTVSDVTQDLQREEFNLSQDGCSTKSHLIDANILMTKRDIVFQEPDPVLECMNTVETFFSFEENELEMSKNETVSSIRGDHFQRNGPSCLSSVKSYPVKDMLDHPESVDKLLVDGYTDDGVDKEVEIDACSGWNCECYSIADIENEMQGLEISNIPSDRGKYRIVNNPTYEPVSAEEDFEYDHCDDISNQGNTSSISEANTEDSSDASLESPNISASVSKDVLQKLTLATTPKNGDIEGSPNLSNFLEEALKPIDDLLLNTSSSETEGSGDDVTPTVPKHCNHARETTEKYPGYTYLSESLQDLLRQNIKGNRLSSRSTLTQGSVDTQETLHNLSQMDSSTEKENITTGESCAFIDTKRFPLTLAVENEREQLPRFMYTTVRDLEGADTSFGRGLYEHIFKTESETEQNTTGDSIHDHSSLISDGKILQELPEFGFMNCHQTDNIEVNTENQTCQSLYRSDCVDDLSNPSSVSGSFTDDMPIQSCQRNLTTCHDTTGEHRDCLINSLSLQDELNAALQEDDCYSFPEVENQVVLEEEDPLHMQYSYCVCDPNDSVNV